MKELPPCNEMQATELLEMPPDLATVVIISRWISEILLYAKAQNIPHGKYKCPACYTVSTPYCQICDDEGSITIDYKSLFDTI